MARNAKNNKIKGNNFVGQVICADCSATDAEWASINRGIILCAECCSVHRSLGRHVSQIKSCNDKDWHPHTWSMVSSLSTGGGNSVWEHTLLDPGLKSSSKKKPQPSDPVHPDKANFIRAKHQMLSFVIQPPGGGDDGCKDASGGGADEDFKPDEEPSQELHSSVRTGNLEISLRLLSQGADPNYYHKDRGNYPLHVAASAGQAEQAELLLAYGALHHFLDSSGNSAAQCASAAGYPELSSRLNDVQYEVVQRLVSYLSDQYTNTVPHSQPYCRSSVSSTDTLTSASCDIMPSTGGGWFLPPQLLKAYQNDSDQGRKARSKLINLSCVPLEELASDLYDEVDRRELETAFASTNNNNNGSSVPLHHHTAAEHCTTPFLPVNPMLSSTRNQARQKLARLKDSEFCSLLVDLLLEVRRRAARNSNGSSVAPAIATSVSSAAPAAVEDEPLYDSVCSEDDYSPLDQPIQDQDNVTPHSEQPQQDHDRVHSTTIDFDGDLDSNGCSAPSSHPPPPSSAAAAAAITQLITNTAANSDESGAIVRATAASPTPSSPRPHSAVVVQVTTHQQQQLVTSSLVPPPSLSPSVGQIGGGGGGGVSVQQYELMKRQLEASEKRIRELQQDNMMMKSQLEKLSNTVAQLRTGTPAPALPLTPSPSAYQTPYNSLPPFHNGADNALYSDKRQSFSNSGSLSLGAIPHHQHHHHHHQPPSSSSTYHQRSDSLPINTHSPSSSTRYFPTPSPDSPHLYECPDEFLTLPQQLPPPLSSQHKRVSPQSSAPPLGRYSSPHAPIVSNTPPSPSSCQPSLAASNQSNSYSNNTPSATVTTKSSKSSSSHLQYYGSGSSSASGNGSSVSPRPYSMLDTPREHRHPSQQEGVLRGGDSMRSFRGGSTDSHPVSSNTYESICNSSEWRGGGGEGSRNSHGEAALSGASNPYLHRSTSFSDELYQDTSLSSATSHTASVPLPTSKEVIAITENITRGIHNLVAVAQRVSDTSQPYPPQYQEDLQLNAISIRDAVQKIVRVFPRNPDMLPPRMHEVLVLLLRNTLSLTSMCQDNSSTTQTLVQAAYSVALATKNLIKCYQ